MAKGHPFKQCQRYVERGAYLCALTDVADNHMLDQSSSVLHEHAPIMHA